MSLMNAHGCITTECRECGFTRCSICSEYCNNCGAKMAPFKRLYLWDEMDKIERLKAWIRKRGHFDDCGKNYGICDCGYDEMMK